MTPGTIQAIAGFEFPVRVDPLSASLTTQFSLLMMEKIAVLAGSSRALVH